jgi:hypothetical protein
MFEGVFSMRLLPFAISLALIAGPAAAADQVVSPRDQATIDRLLKGKVAGDPISCIAIPRSGGSTIAGNRIYYRGTGRTVYVNDPGPSCGLRSGSAIVIKTPANQFCRGDIITLFEPSSGMDRGSCALGEFTPWTDPR